MSLPYRPKNSAGTPGQLLSIPIEIRSEIFGYLLDSSYNTRQADYLPEKELRRYRWSLHPTILRVNHQIHDEAKAILQLRNDFVVIELGFGGVLGRKKGEARLYQGKRGIACADVSPPLMTVRLEKDHPPTGADTEILVLPVEELRDFCTGISTRRDKEGNYRTSGLYATFSIALPQEAETKKQTKHRETSLLEPFTKWRCLSSVTIDNASKGYSQFITQTMKRRSLDHLTATKTIAELLSASTTAQQLTHYEVGLAYCHMANQFLIDIDEHVPDLRDRLGIDYDALVFQILSASALLSIEGKSFQEAFESVELALLIAHKLDIIPRDPDNPPPHARTKGKYRKWFCAIADAGCRKIEQKITLVQLGKLHYYRSISGHAMFGDESDEEHDKLLGIALCLQADRGEVIQELLHFDIKICSPG